jgi:hypothetical protein
MGVRLGPSLLPTAEQARSREQRRAGVHPTTGLARHHNATAAAPPPIAVRVGEVHLRGISRGVDPHHLRAEVERAMRSAMIPETRTLATHTPAPALRHDASVSEMARSIADAIAKHAGDTSEEIR